jgi:hypothetical protein
MKFAGDVASTMSTAIDHPEILTATWIVGLPTQYLSAEDTGCKNGDDGKQDFEYINVEGHVLCLRAARI